MKPFFLKRNQWGLWDPEDHGLDPNFWLTNYTQLPQAQLLEYLKSIKSIDQKSNETPGLDCAVVKSKIPGYYSISTTDFFYPLVDDPYQQGRIAACNVISDMYAMGVYEIDTMLMILGVCRDMPQKERDYATTELIHGFSDLAHDAATNVTGGQTVMNPWPMIGGVASSICRETEIKGVPRKYDGKIAEEDIDGDFIWPDNGQPGDVLVLTKPLGIQLAVNCFEWLRKPGRYEEVQSIISVEQIISSYKIAMESMSSTNYDAAKLMHKYHAHGCTDVTGFGILGHSMNLAAQQVKPVNLVIDHLPYIEHMLRVNDFLNNRFRLRLGTGAETSGGLLIMMTPEDAKEFVKEFKEVTGHTAWIIGQVVEGERKALLAEEMEMIEVKEW